MNIQQLSEGSAVTPMTPEEIAAVEARCDAAPEGPWFWQKNYECYPGCHTSEDDCGQYADYERHWALYSPQSKAENRCLNFRLVTLSTSSNDFDGQPVENTPMFRFIAHARTDVPRLIATIRAEQQRAEALSHQLEADRTKVAECITAANKAIDGRHWLTEGRGCYEWNDDRWHDEFRYAAIEIKTALEPMTKIAADWTGCPQTTEQVAQARIDWQQRAEAAEAETRRLREACERVLGARSLGAAWDAVTGAAQAITTPAQPEGTAAGEDK